MDVHLVDGTYELFRHHFGAPPRQDTSGTEVGAMVGVLGSVLYMLEQGATHIGVATDHVVESFRNDMWPGYKTGEGIEPTLLAQFHPLEDALETMGVRVWRMREQEADDGMAAAATKAAADDRVRRIYLCTPDKDLAQCVVGDRVVQLDRRARVIRNEDGIRKKFGVGPASIPDYLALVGDSADGFPGVRGWGAKSAGAVLGRYEHLEAIPTDPAGWDLTVRGAARLARSLAEDTENAHLFRDLATLRRDADVFASVDDIRWQGPTAEFHARCRQLNAPELYTRASAAAGADPAGSGSDEELPI